MRLILSVLIAFTLLGQDKKAEEKPPTPINMDRTGYEAEIIHVKSLSGDAFTRLSNLLQPFQVEFQADEKLRTIVVYGPKDTVAQMKKVVEQLDRPGSLAAVGKNIEMNLSFLLCSPPSDSKALDIPKELASVARQLENTMGCKDVKFIDTIPIRMKEGDESRTNNNALPLLMEKGSPSAATRFFPEAIIQTGTSRYVRFQRAMISLHLPFDQTPSSIHFRNVDLETSGDFKEGQKTVIGKLSGKDTSIFAVIDLKILD